MRKLLGKTSSDLSADSSAGPSIGLARSAGLSSRISPRPASSQDMSYHAGRPISCLDASPDGRIAVLASRHMIRTIKIDGKEVRDGVDVTAVIKSQAASSPTNSSVADQLSIRDAKWYGDSSILTACASGNIFYYDLAHLQSGIPIKYASRLEDARQVNHLAINPHRATHILAGTMDGIVRYLDLRVSPNEYAPFKMFKCDEGIRQVQWSPSEGMIFASCTDSGSIFKWDIRMGLLLRINGHDKACTSICWHPDGQHLLSSGLDTKCHVWDLSEHASKRQKAKYTITTPAPVSSVAWRPGIWSASAQGKRVAQFAATYDDRDPSPRGWPGVQFWDLARPTVPYKCIKRFDKLPSALLWRDKDLLWTVGGDSYFQQCDLAFAQRPIDHMPLSTLAISSRGDVTTFLDERPPPTRLSRRPTTQTVHLSRAGYGRDSSLHRMDLSLSDSEDDIVHNFLSVRRSGTRPDSYNSRSPTMPSTTSLSATNIPNLGLDAGMEKSGLYSYQQALVSGHLPSTVKPYIYHYLSGVYLETLERELPSSPGGKSLPIRLASVLGRYARAAELVGFFRLAQTWRIIGYGMSLLLNRRAQYHLERRTIQINDSNLSQDSDSVAGSARGRETSESEFRLRSSRSILSLGLESVSTAGSPPTIARKAGADLLLSAPSISDLNGHQPSSSRIRRYSVATSIASEDLRQTPSPAESDAEGHARTMNMHGLRTRQGKHLDPTEPKFVAGRSRETGRNRSSLNPAKPALKRHGSGLSGEDKLSSSRTDLEWALRRGQGKDMKLALPASQYGVHARSKQFRQSPDRTASSIRLPRRSRTYPLILPDESFVSSQTSLTTERAEDIKSMAKVGALPLPNPLSIESVSHTAENAVTQAVTSQPQLQLPTEPDPPEPAESRETLEEDYLPWADDPPYPYPISSSDPKWHYQNLPIAPDPYRIITRAIGFETRTSALNASAMVLLLKPLLPEGVIDSIHAAAIVRQHYSRLMNMNMSVEAALLRNLCVPGWPAGVPGWRDSYPAIFSPAQNDVKVTPACPSCHKVHDPDRAVSDEAARKCERCAIRMDHCAVCGQRDAVVPTDPQQKPFAPTLELAATSPPSHPDAPLSTWWYCPTCKHGGHASCLHIWHAALPSDPNLATASLPDDQTRPPLPQEPETKYSGGCCPLDGCGHACLPDRLRSNASPARSDDWDRSASDKARTAAPLHSGPDDGVAVPHSSRAVDFTHDPLLSVASASAHQASSILSSSPGRSERDRRKSVKFASANRRVSLA